MSPPIPRTKPLPPAGSENGTEKLPVEPAPHSYAARYAAAFASDGAGPRSPDLLPTEELPPEAFAPEPSDLDETLRIPTSDFSAISGELPYDPPVDPEPMTLERYAAIGAQLAAGDQREVLARLGVTRDAWVIAMSEMALRFKAEPDLEAQYHRLMRELLGLTRPV